MSPLGGMALLEWVGLLAGSVTLWGWAFEVSYAQVIAQCLS